MADAAAHTDAHDHAAGGEHHAHAVPLWILIGVFLILLFLTFITVAATWIDIGYTGNIIIAMSIAVVKAAFVALYFMHLRWDNLFNGFILISSLAFVALFIVIAAMDKGEYQPEIREKKIQEVIAAN